jgi:hypothetical protein
MKKLLLALFCALCVSLSFAQAPALAAAPCDQTLNTGAATTKEVFWFQPLAFNGWSGGVITNDMYFNGCGSTVSLKINGEDWERLRQAGKLDGLRYIKYDGTNLGLRKIQGTQPVDVSKDNFFDNTTTLVYKGNR